MKVNEYPSLNRLAGDRWDLAIHGGHVDDRDARIREFLSQSAEKVSCFRYIPEDMKACFDDLEVELHDLPDALERFRASKIVVDATSFNAAEFAIICKSLKATSNLDFDVIYAEPEDYLYDSSNGERLFNLSESSLGFEDAGVPGLSKPIQSDEPKIFVFFMGYEGERFRNALEISELRGDECSLVFGVPPFQFGWDKNSLLSSARAIIENDLKDAFLFCGANNIRGVFRLLQDLRKKHAEETFFLVPLGPKPMTIGAVKFLCDDENSALLYDHPERSTGRSVGIANVHLTRGFLVG